MLSRRFEHNSSRTKINSELFISNSHQNCQDLEFSFRLTTYNLMLLEYVLSRSVSVINSVIYFMVSTGSSESKVDREDFIVFIKRIFAIKASPFIAVNIKAVGITSKY